MRLLGAVLTVGVVVLLGASDTGAAGEKNAEKIVGKWEATKGDIPPGTMAVFSKDGKLKFSGKKDDKEFSFKGTYTVEGEKLTVTMKFGDKEKTDSSTIKTLDDTTLVLENAKDKGKTVEFKRVK